jgi:acetyl/propionyl-CoA carboxylase alpha subunit
MVYATDREQAILRMRRALAETLIDGVPTNVPFLREVMDDPLFRSGDVYTDYVAMRHHEESSTTRTPIGV